MSSQYSLNFSGFTDLISVLLAHLLYCTTRAFFSGVGVSLPEGILSLVAAIEDISLWDEMSVFHLFSICSGLVAGGMVLFFPLTQVRKCLTLPVALQYLKYQIMIIIITITLILILLLLSIPHKP